MSLPLHSERWTALGTGAALVLHGARDPRAARAAVDDELAAIDRACSRFRDDSELAAVNAAGGRTVRISALLAEAIAVALRAASLTGGLVDPTIGEAIELAGYDRDFAAVRGSHTLQVRAVTVPGWQVVALDRDAGTVRVPAGVRLDLGATAKAHAADRAAVRARAAGDAEGALVNLGGDIATAGTARAGGWRVRVTDRHDAPLDAPGQDIAVHSGGLATSSVTARRWQRGDDIAHHIIDPRIGRPAAAPWRTVSVAAGTCVDANTAATAAIVLGEHASQWLEAAHLPARLVGAGGAVHVTAGWPAEPAVAA